MLAIDNGGYTVRLRDHDKTVCLSNSIALSKEASVFVADQAYAQPTGPLHFKRSLEVTSLTTFSPLYTLLSLSPSTHLISDTPITY